MMGDEEAEHHEEVAAAAGGEGEGEGEGEGGVAIDARAGKYKIHIAEQQLPLVGLFAVSIVLLIAMTTGIAKYDKFYGYGVAVAAVAMFFSFIGLVLTMMDNLNAMVGKYNNYFLFLWCFIGAIILTFPGPFQETGNGYFASWGLAIFSMMGVGVSGESMRSAKSPLLGLLASAIIVLIAIIPEFNIARRDIVIYTLVIVCLTIVVAGAFLYLERNIGAGPSKTQFFVLAVFAILWIVLACFTTFVGPFLVTGNGYFGSWGGAFTSVFAAMAALN